MSETRAETNRGAVRAGPDSLLPFERPDGVFGRHNRKLTQEQLAKKSKVSREMIAAMWNPGARMGALVLSRNWRER
jgi:hypothetical protein